MEKEDSILHERLKTRLRQLRLDQGLTLDALAERAGVSRSMISLIERGESSPTAAVLHRIAVGLEVSLASLFAEAEQAGALPLVRRSDQVTWRDPETGYVRRNLAPPGYPSPLELVEVVLPAGSRVAYDTASGGISELIWIIDGVVEITFGETAYRLETGDCLALHLDRPTSFWNPLDSETHYIVALTKSH